MGEMEVFQFKVQVEVIFMNYSTRRDFSSHAPAIELVL